jgi:hypothetical protein
MEPNIYIAGPLLNAQPNRSYSVLLKLLYLNLETEAKLAEVRIQVPYYEEKLDRLDAVEFTREIRRRIQKADALLAVIIDEDWSQLRASYSVACEAQMAADEGKPIAIVAQHPDRVPRLLRSLATDGEMIQSLTTTDFRKIFLQLTKRLKKR